MKIIFLDIDGVLNSDKSELIEKNTQDNILRELKIVLPHEMHVRWLNEIVKKTGAKVVISSTWRINNSLLALSGLLVYVGFKYFIFDKTPIISNSGSLPRGEEIRLWLKYNSTVRHIDSYVILDDDNDMLEEQQKNFVLIDGYRGLDECYAAKAIEILNGKKDEKDM
jgi:hypothetical protein